MANFCGKCGSKLDEKTGLCPQCDQANFSKKKKGKKAVKAFIAIVCSVSILAAGIYGALRFLNKDKVTYAYSEYNSFMEGFTDVIITDEKSAIEAVGSVADVLGITDAEKELKVVSVNNIDTDSYYRMQQYYNNIPVYGKTIVISADKNGNATALTSNYSSIAEDISLKPTATQKELNKSVQKYFNDDSVTFSVDDSNLVLYQTENRGTVLCYELIVLSNRIVIDANTAEILLTTELYVQDVVECMYENYGKDTTFLGTKISENEYLLGNEQEGIFVFNADYKEAMKENKNEEGAILGYYTVPEKSLSMTSTDNYFGNNDRFATEEYAKAVYALNSLQTMANYYETLNPEQNTSVAVTINNGFEPDNAYGGYNNIKDVTDATIPYQKEEIISILFGKDLCNDIYGNLDTLGHEYMHGITHSNVKLDRQESMAIDEAYSDIFGELLEELIKGEAPDWKHGNRNMVTPNNGYYLYPATLNELENADIYKENGKEIGYYNTPDSYTDFSHLASTIFSHCAYLMWNGIDGTSQKIQQPELGEIWYRSLMLLQDNADFSQCRNAVELSARTMLKNGDLKEEQYKTVITAFEKTGIENATFTFKEVVKNKFDLSVLGSNGTEDTTYKLEIIKYPEFLFDFNISEKHLPEPFMEKSKVTGRQTLELENGLYVLRITDVNDDRNISKSINIKIKVNGKSKDAKDEIVVNTDFTDVITVILNEDPSDNADEWVDITDESDTNSSPDSAVDIYMAYADKIQEYEAKYGCAKNVILNDNFSFVSGLAFVDLVDFSNSGKECLMLVYNTNPESVQNTFYAEYKYEIWDFDGEKTILLETGGLFGSDGGETHIIITEYQNKRYLVTGAADAFGKYEYHSFVKDGAFGVVRSVEWESDDAYEKNQGLINGKIQTYEKIQEEQEEWLKNQEHYSLMYDGEKIIKHNLDTKHTLLPLVYEQVEEESPTVEDVKPETIMTADEIYQKLVERYSSDAYVSTDGELYVVEGEIYENNQYCTSVRCGVPGNPNASQRLYDVVVDATTGDTIQTRVFDNQIVEFNLKEDITS